MYVTKPAFEQFRHELTGFGRPMREKDIVPIEHALVTSLETFHDLLVEKVRRVPHAETMLEISARWLGLDANPDDVVQRIRRDWSDDVLGSENARFHVLTQDDAVILAFAAPYADVRYLTGRMKIIF